MHPIHKNVTLLAVCDRFRTTRLATNALYATSDDRRFKTPRYRKGTPVKKLRGSRTNAKTCQSVFQPERRYLTLVCTEIAGPPCSILLSSNLSGARELNTKQIYRARTIVDKGIKGEKRGSGAMFDQVISKMENEACNNNARSKRTEREMRRASFNITVTILSSQEQQRSAVKLDTDRMVE